MQIGDLLGDKESYAFAKEMASKLDKNVYRWTGNDECEDLKDAFLALNPNLKGIVVQSMDHRSDLIDDVAKNWPLPMQNVCS